MTELGEQFILALVNQGYGVTFDDEDAIILSHDRRIRAHIPMVLLQDPAHELLLMWAIASFVETFGLRWAIDEEGGEPGLN